MIRWSSCAVLCAALFVCAASEQANGEIVLSTFEEQTLANQLSIENAFEGLIEQASQFRSGAVTFNNNGVFFGGTSWSGFGYARRTAVGPQQELYNNSNDLISLPAVGVDSSPTWAVVGNGGTMTADAGYLFTSVNLTNTLYTWDSIANGDNFAGPPMSKNGGRGRFAGVDDFFIVKFTNLDTNQALDYYLADFRKDSGQVNVNWDLFNLSSLNASRISVSFLGSRETNYGDVDNPFYFMDTPAYAAFDNITVTAVPEPGSCLLVVAGVLVAARRMRRARRTGE